MIEMIILYVLVALISFITGMLVVLINYYKNNKKPKTYEFKEPSTFKSKTSADSYMNSPSCVDGSKASDKFNK